MTTTKKTITDNLCYEHNWAQTLLMAYTYHTVVVTGRTRNEQRKSMGIPPIRTMEVAFLTEYDQTTQLLNWLRYYQSAQEAVVHVPIYCEPIRPTRAGDLFGWQTLAVDDLTGCII